MSLDIDDLGIELVHRLGSLHHARLKSDPPKRPTIAAFCEYRHTNVVLDAAYMLRTTDYSVSRDYPKEILSARKRLMPQFKAERQNKRNKVSVEYPAKLVVNGRVIADEFPDWHYMLSQDTYKLANGGTFVEPAQQQELHQQQQQKQQQQNQQQQELRQQQML